MATGVVKSFDPSKGFGFVVMDGPEPREDALLHISALRAINAVQVSPKSKIECEVVRGEKGLSVQRIISLEGSDGTPEDPADFVSAQVKWYDTTRGYGFLTQVDVPGDIFIHAEVVKGAGLLDLRIDQVVSVKLEISERGKRVTRIRRAG